MKKTLVYAPKRRLSFQSFPIRARLVSGLTLLALAAALGLAASRPAHTAGGPIAVTVANTPLAVTGTDASAQQPVEGYIEVTSQSRLSFGNLVYTVPAGKRLIVQSMTLIGNPVINTIGYTAFVRNQNPDGSLLSVVSLSAPAGAGAIASVTQPMHSTIEPGGSVSANVFRPDTGPLDVFVSLSGYLVDAP